MLTPTRVVEITSTEAAHIKQHQLVVASVLTIPDRPGPTARARSQVLASMTDRRRGKTGKTKPCTCAAFVVKRDRNTTLEHHHRFDHRRRTRASSE